MMGRTHVIAGAISGELLAHAFGVRNVGGQAICVAIGSAGGILPDIDCGSSMVTRALGPVGWILSHLLRGFSHALYAVTKGPRDERCEGEHRHASHTILFAVLVGLLLAAGCLPLAAQLPLSPWLAGAALAAGCVSHCLTDAMTVAGCPFLFPLPIGGETWWEVRLLGPWSFHTGSVVERRFWRPLFMVGAVLLIPGVVPALVNAWQQTRGGPPAAVR